MKYPKKQHEKPEWSTYIIIRLDKAVHGKAAVQKIVELWKI